MRYELYRDSDGGWRFRLVAANNEIIATGESYRNRKDCLGAIELVKLSKDAPVRMVRKVK